MFGRTSGRSTLLLWLHTLNSNSGHGTFPTINFVIGARSPWDAADALDLLMRTAVKPCNERVSPKIFSSLPLMGPAARKIRACVERLAALVT